MSDIEFDDNDMIVPTPALEAAWDDFSELVLNDKQFYQDVITKIGPFHVTRLFKIAQDAQKRIEGDVPESG